MAKEMRIKSVGATINLGNYSSLHIEIGEQSEFAGLDLGKCEKYLRACAKSVGGVLNLPEEKPKSVQPAPKAANAKDFIGDPVGYDNSTHIYVNEKGVKYTSVTQMLETFYPFEADVIGKQYLDFAANFGNLIHCAIQNAVSGKPPKKKTVAKIVEGALSGMGEFRHPLVEEIICDHEHEIAGRFDIMTQHMEDDNYTLWDVKTNSSMYNKVTCTLPDELKKEFSQYWNTDTTFGEHCLQLNIYAYILNKYYLSNEYFKTDGRINELNIIYVPDGYEEIIKVPLVDISKIFDAYARCR